MKMKEWWRRKDDEKIDDDYKGTRASYSCVKRVEGVKSQIPLILLRPLIDETEDGRLKEDWRLKFEDWLKIDELKVQTFTQNLNATHAISMDDVRAANCAGH